MARHDAVGWNGVKLAVLLGVMLGTVSVWGQGASGRAPRLPSDQWKGGIGMLDAFSEASRGVRSSIGKLDVDGGTVALATFIREDGMALTKASQLRDGRLTCWLPGGREVEAELLAVDDENDVALVRVRADRVVPVRWAAKDAAVGQWAITPGIEERPHAVGIVSVTPRRIAPRRAFIGVELDLRAPVARVSRVTPGLGAEEAGIRSGDTILSVNGDPVGRGDALVSRLREFREGQTVRLEVRREDEVFEASIRMRVPPIDTELARMDREERLNRMGGDVSDRAEGFDQALQHDSVLPPWLCGGPLVNLAGEAIGVNIARAGRVASFALPPELARRIGEALIARAQEISVPMNGVNHEG
ncbi:MAG: PDZ domain-containing protein [Verrucomicrobiae bacterium]|nr:PDZ domain-containing protein [Verrucomicrobiae bacterium]